MSFCCLYFTFILEVDTDSMKNQITKEQSDIQQKLAENTQAKTIGEKIRTNSRTFIINK